MALRRALAGTAALIAVTADCPAGTFAHGTGDRLSGTLLHEGITSVVPGTLPTGEVARADVDEFGQPGPWSLIAILICDP